MKRLLILVTLLLAGLLGACDAPAETTSFEVFFDTMGGSEIDAITVDLADPVSAPDDPVKEGYVFDGWYLDENYRNAYDFANPITGDLTLYAKWVEDTDDDPDDPISETTITFVSNGGSAVAPITADAGSPVTAPAAPTREGFVFGGWYTDASFTTPFTFDDMPQNDVTLYAKWIAATVDTVTITFHTNGGSIVNAIVAEPGDAIGPPAEPIKEGFVFGGWYADSALTTAYEIPTVMPDVDTDVYAKWINPADLVYTVSFESNGGSFIEPVVQTKGQNITPPVDPTKDNFVFDGWFTDSQLTNAYGFDDAPTSDFTLYAAWVEDTAGMVRLSFETFDGTPIDDLWVEPGVYTLLPTHTYLEGHAFFAWYYNATLTSRAPLGIAATSDMTFYAKYEAFADIVVFTFDSNGGSYVYPIWAGVGRMVDQPDDPVKTGYDFDGWYTDEALTNPYYMWYQYEDITLYAKWTEQTNSGEVIIDTLKDVLIAWEFTCTGNVCEYEIASGFTYIVHVDTGVFIYDKHTVEEGDGGYRNFDSVITIDDNWDVDYTYSVDENFGYQINTDLTVEGNVLTATYNVTFFDSNVTTEASRFEAAVSSIEYFAAFVEDLLEAAGITMDAFN